ncbi:MAG TPA: hypothetical protein DCR21_00470 [Succinivibrionaceae bacterium]|nr:hypothetical protein [Succinivibrionaceae bacterium]
MANLKLSSLNKTWILDLDGTLLVHNGYKEKGDSFLPGALEFLKKIPDTDFVLILTSRTEEYREATEKFLRKHGVRYNNIIFNIPFGERILINDKKKSGLNCAYAISLIRDEGLSALRVNIDKTI